MIYSNRMMKLLKLAQPAQPPIAGKAPSARKVSINLATSLLPFAEYLVNPGLNLQNVASKGMDPKWSGNAKKVYRELKEWNENLENAEENFPEKYKNIFVSMYQAYRAMFQLKQIYDKHLKVKITNPASYKMLFEQQIPQLTNYVYQTLSKVSRMGKVDYFSKEYRQQALEEYRKSLNPQSNQPPAASTMGGFKFINDFIVKIKDQINNIKPPLVTRSETITKIVADIKTICEQARSELKSNDQINPSDKENIQFYIDNIRAHMANYQAGRSNFDTKIVTGALNKLQELVPGKKSSLFKQNLVKKAQDADASYVANNDPMSLKTISELKNLGIGGLQVLERYGQYAQVNVFQIIDNMTKKYLDKYGTGLKLASEELYNYVAEINTLCQQKNLQSVKEYLGYLASLSKESFEVTDAEVQTTSGERGAIRRAEEAEYSKNTETMIGDLNASYAAMLQDAKTAQAKMQETINILNTAQQWDDKISSNMKEVSDLYNLNSPSKYDYYGNAKNNPVKLQINKILNPSDPEPWNIPFYESRVDEYPDARKLYDIYQKLVNLNELWGWIWRITGEEFLSKLTPQKIIQNKYQVLKELKDTEKKFSSGIAALE